MQERDFSRHERVAGQLRRELATLIWAEIKDPRLGTLSVTDVEVSRDLSRARVYIASATPESVPESLKVLRRAAGFLRRRLSQTLRLRVVPEFSFLHDDSMERGARIDDLLSQVSVPADKAE